MSIRNKLFIKDFIYSIILFAFIYILREYDDVVEELVYNHTQNISISIFANKLCNQLIVVAFLFYIIAWAVWVRNTINHKKIRHLLEMIAGTMLFWFLVRTIKYDFAEGIMNRYLWYLYYIAFLFIPLLSYRVSLFIGHNESFRLSKIHNIEIITTVLLFIGIISNEYHHLMFQFDPIQFAMDNRAYSYGILYFIVAFWMLLLIITSLTIIDLKCYNKLSKQRLWMPLCIVAVLIIYVIIYGYFKIYINEVTIVFIWMDILFWKSLIYSGLIPSNFIHADIFNESSVTTIIIDQDYNINYLSKNAKEFADVMIQKLESHSNKLDERTIIKQSKIKGGSVLWLEDISSMNINIAKLRKLQKQIQESNELLQAEVSLKEKEEKIHTETMVYNSIVIDLEESIHLLNESLQESDPDLMYICLLGSYIKRTSNLIILKQNQSTVQYQELEYCMREILDILKIKIADVTFINNQKEPIVIDTLKNVYDVFVHIILEIYPVLSSMLVTYDCTEGMAKLKIVFEANQNQIERINIDGLMINQEDHTYYLTYIYSEDLENE